MSNAVWASLFHCTSTDEDLHHARCSQGTASWCFYQRASASGEPPMTHKGNTNTPVNRKVAQLLTVYKRLSDPELLRRCLRKRTQNANESLHGVIWSRCPKHFCFSGQSGSGNSSVCWGIQHGIKCQPQLHDCPGPSCG